MKLVGHSVFALLAISLSLGGCVTNSQQSASVVSAGEPDLTDQIREVDLSPRFPQRIRSSGQHSQRGPRVREYFGKDTPPSGVPVSSKKGDPLTTGSTNATSNKGYEINFENTPIPTVAKAVLGDILGIPYVIDPRVKGTVSLSSGRAVPREDLLYVVENALRVSNVALVRKGDGYRLVPTGDAVGTGSVDRGHPPDAGYGISVIPLQYISASVLTKLIENFSAKPGMVRPDAWRNLLLIQGNAADRRSAIETARSFDVDWMQGQSVGIYPISNSTPEPIIAELNRIIDTGQGGLDQDVVKLLAIQRENAILVVTRKRTLLKRVATWISRLDQSGGASTGVKVYRMRYADAGRVAALLNQMFLGSSGESDSNTNELVPNGGIISSSSDRPETGHTSPPNAAGSQTRIANPNSQKSRVTPASFIDRFSGGNGQRFSQTAGGSFGSTNGGPSALGASGNGKPILANVRIAPDIVNNSLLIYASQDNYAIIKRALQQIDRPQLQVAIHATIAEVTLNDELRYGVQFYLSSKDVGLKADKGSVLNSALKQAANAVISRVAPGFNFLLGSEQQPRLILDALRRVTDVKLLSTPSVVVLDNQYASLQVGDEIPITVRSAQSVDTSPNAPIVNNIEYRNTGVILRVAPRINANGNVMLKIEQEISSVANTPNANTLTPTVSQRRVESSISVANGQTVLLGGLISERRDRVRDNIPGIEQVPVVSELFAHRDGIARRTELIIFIQPEIIRNSVDASQVAQALRSKMRGFGSPPLPPPLPPPPPRPPLRPQYRPQTIHNK